MFSILHEAWNHIRSLKPEFLSRTPHFSFMILHSFYIMGMAILGSICLYPNGGIAYIDALFFASGSATQSGLNTVNLNDLNTWQQIVLYGIAFMCNPMIINSFVVFLRLYWFEKRFQHIVKESKRNRRTIGQTMTKSKTEDIDLEREERGVGDRSIVVMHETTRANGMTNDASVPGDLEAHMEKQNALNHEEHARSSDSSSDPDKEKTSDPGDDRQEEAQHQPQIKFADQVHRSNGMSDEVLRMPTPRAQEDHIAFLQRQRDPGDGAVLRIPGPRDADAGIAPQAVDVSDAVSQTFSHRLSVFSSRRDSNETNALNGDDRQDNHEDPRSRSRNITIQEPKKRPSPTKEHLADDVTAARHALGALRFRKHKVIDGEKISSESEDKSTSGRKRSNTFNSIKKALTKEKDEGIPYLSWEPTIGRNSVFVDLTESQREELGGLEYRALKTLAVILTFYIIGFSIFGIVGLLPWILHHDRYGSIVEQDGQGRVWWALFTANSAFTDLGFTLTPDSMISFQPAVWPLLLMSFLIVIGNTGFPIMLRIIIWVTSKYIPSGSGLHDELVFLLHHPRRCFTLLFPGRATWWLFWILVILNGLDLLFFIILDLGNSIVTQLPVNVRILDGWFQAVSTRTAGFGVVNLAELHPAIQVSYLIMMYISVLPIAVSVRRTNVYEENSLGIYGSRDDENEDEGEPSYVGAHLRRQLSFDLWYIFLGLFIIAIAEGSRLQSGDPAFTMFSVLFEIVSAYGTVGLSLGYTNIDASLSAEFSTVSKLVIIAMQIRGRHRGLPYELDRAILLPSEHLHQKEADAAAAVTTRRRSSLNASQMAGAIGSVRSKSRSRSRSIMRDGTHMLNSFLSLGPVSANDHRSIHKGDPHFESRHNLGPPSIRSKSRSASPHASGVSFPAGDATTEEHGRVEGRRHFYQEGVNPLPADANDENTNN